MTIDEAIAKFKFIANSDANCPAHCNISCDKCVQESKQLAEWLEELKDYRDKNKMVVRIDVENMDSVEDKINDLSKYAESQYNKAIDDFAGRLIRYVDCGHLCSPTEMRWSDLSVVEMVKKLAEQLKAGGENERSI